VHEHCSITYTIVTENNKHIHKNFLIFPRHGGGRMAWINVDKGTTKLFIDFKKAYDSVRRAVLYKILIEFGIPKKLVSLIKMSLTETYSRVRVGKIVSDRFPISNGLKQGDALTPLLFNFALEYAIRRGQVKQDGLKLNGTHQLLAYADDVNILGGSIHTLKENVEALVAATRETGLEVSADKTKYMVMFRDQNAEQNHSVRTDNITFEWVEEFRYLGTNLTIRNSIREEIKNTLRSGNACYRSVQDLLSSRLLSRKLKIKIYNLACCFVWVRSLVANVEGGKEAEGV